MNDVVNSPNLVGHPYAPIGMGEQVRCTFRSLRSVALRPALVDIFGLVEPDQAAQREFGPYANGALDKVNIYHINGNEVARCLKRLEPKRHSGSYDIVYPLWELSHYPEVWARQLDRFEEIWAPTNFIFESLVSACKKPIKLMPSATEVVLTSFLGRRYFGISEKDYLFLFFFDLRSYWSRKNPGAVIDAFRRLVAKRPGVNASLVIKIGGVDLAPEMLEQLLSDVQDLRDKVIVLDQVMTDNEVKNLVRCCDCFVSLHRSEGYGRGLAEAMFLGKPVISTAYSGNMDFMSPDTALLVPYELIPLTEGSYPHWEGQVWADPDIEYALHHMIHLVDDPRRGCALGENASRHIRVEFGYRACGMRYRNRLEEIDNA